ncbi:MAG: metallopeptidase family protein [Hyphomonadaceae bacterium]
MTRSTDGWGAAPTLEDFAELAETALDGLAEPFRSLARGVPIRIEDLADEETLEALHIEDPYHLTGLYSGVTLTLEALSAPSHLPAMIWLYRLAILDEWARSPGVTLEELVAHVLVHELGRHFGWSDEEMDAALATRAS